MSDLVRRLSIPNEIAVFMWKPFLLPGENQRDYEMLRRMMIDDIQQKRRLRKRNLPPIQS
jgi:hypothetical protein